jgi:hypothetical protein
MSGVKVEVPAVAPALGVSLKIQLDPMRELVFQTHVERDEPNLHQILDRITGAGDRQAKKYRLITLHRELGINETRLKDMRADLVHIDRQAQEEWIKTGRKGDFKLSSTQREARKNAEITDARGQEIIQRIKDEIATLESEIAVG